MFLAYGLSKDLWICKRHSTRILPGIQNPDDFNLILNTPIEKLEGTNMLNPNALVICLDTDVGEFGDQRSSIIKHLLQLFAVNEAFVPVGPIVVNGCPILDRGQRLNYFFLHSITIWLACSFVNLRPSWMSFRPWSRAAFSTSSTR